MGIITTERLTKILSETQAAISECNSRGVHGSVEVNSRLFENVLMELLRHRDAMFQGAENAESTTTMQTAPALDSSPKIAESTSGNSPVIPDEVLSAVRKVACIREDFDDFDGDRRGIGDCLDEAEQELIVTINKYASVIAAAPQQEVKP